ncbi:transposon Ty3-I Gag-Pol polyprotein [Nephila pilipes]|uniref:Transposon Ty3-I Gag-Pol polyprotein n=1 Tax=Nephila pilipes TaxID=299642 RepID=A0A8X6IKZ7_NEPPI|nr:transposon Ty3-I Gag-Pol polyprotein [Nephila pilipes]
MKSLAGNSISDEVTKSLWLHRLPQQTQTILSISNDTLDKMADKVIAVYSSSEICQITKVGSLPNSGSSSDRNKLEVLQADIAILLIYCNKNLMNFLEILGPAANRDEMTDEEDPDLIQLDTNFAEINLDIIGPLPSSEGFRYFLTIIDRYSRWPEAIPLSDIRAETVADNLFKGYIARFGTPLVITTDQGTQFEAQLFQELSKLIGFKLNRTTSYHPQANGCIER